MPAPKPLTGTTEHARLVLDIVEAHGHEEEGSPHVHVCQLCGRWAKINGVIHGMATGSHPQGVRCGRHGSRRRAWLEPPDRYCRICATTVGPASRSEQLCGACAPVWADVPHERMIQLSRLRGAARRRGRAHLRPLLRIVEHGEPRSVAVPGS